VIPDPEPDVFHPVSDVSKPGLPTKLPVTVTSSVACEVRPCASVTVTVVV
jgi:hypothetical protein